MYIYIYIIIVIILLVGGGVNWFVRARVRDCLSLGLPRPEWRRVRIGRHRCSVCSSKFVENRTPATTTT